MPALLLLEQYTTAVITHLHQEILYGAFQLVNTRAHLVHSTDDSVGHLTETTLLPSNKNIHKAVRKGQVEDLLQHIPCSATQRATHVSVKCKEHRVSVSHRGHDSACRLSCTCSPSPTRSMPTCPHDSTQQFTSRLRQHVLGRNL